MPDETITLHHDPMFGPDGSVAEFVLENRLITDGPTPMTLSLSVTVSVCKHCGVLYDTHLNGMCAARLYEQFKTRGSPVAQCPARWVPGILSGLPREPIPCGLFQGHPGDHLFSGIDPSDVGVFVPHGRQDDDFG